MCVDNRVRLIFIEQATSLSHDLFGKVKIDSCNLNVISCIRMQTHVIFKIKRKTNVELYQFFVCRKLEVFLIEN